jgi:uncharacterized alpha-E superfamily protein
VLLSRVAESVYWTGRYLERAESTARIVKVHTELFLDMPKSAGLGWSPLLATTGAADAYQDHHPKTEEDLVVGFLVADRRNPGSVLASLEQARESVRVTRSLFPREAWEALNDLYLVAAETCEEAISRRSRLRWCEEVINGCQRITGTMAGTMSHDAAYSFLRIGRHIERADMTTRVLDVRAGTLINDPERQLRPYSDLLWMSVLKSLSAYQMYRRSVQSRVKGSEVLRFLLRDIQFPRSVEHCLTEISRCLLELPHHEEAMKVCAATEERLVTPRVASLAWEGLHEFVDQLQVQLTELHDSMATTYFLTNSEPSQALLASA